MKQDTRNSAVSVYQRLLSMLLCAVMLLSYVPSSFVVALAADTPTYTSGISISLAGYGSELHIYNNNHFNTPAGEDGTGSGAFTLTDNGTLSVFIGDHPEETEDWKQPSAQDIIAAMNAMTLNGDLTIYPVNSGQFRVSMGVIGDTASRIDGNLLVAADAKLTLDVQQDLHVDTLTLGEGSELVVNVSAGKTLTIAALDGAAGSITVNGSGTVALGEEAAEPPVPATAKSLEVTDATLALETSLHVTETLALNSAAVTGNTTAGVTADGTITVSGGRIESLALFGYGNEATGDKTITFRDSTELNGVTNLGVDPAGNAWVTIEGIDTLRTVSNSRFTADFPITYTHNGNTLTDAKYDAARGYRAEFDNTGNLTLLGVHSTAGISTGVFDLPRYEEPGYTFNGWHINDSALTYNSLMGEGSTPVIAAVGALTLTTDVTAGGVAVTFDHGFTPDAYSHECDKGKTWSVTTDKDGEPVAVGSVIDVEHHPTRFGHKFTHWEITTGNGGTISTDTKEYTIAYEDLAVDENGALSLGIKACWEVKDSYPLRFNLNGTVDLQYIEMSFNGGENWYHFVESRQDEAVQYIDKATGYGTIYTWDPQYNNFTFPGRNIRYGETIGDFLQGIGLSSELAILRDNRAVEQAQSFGAWVANGKAIDSASPFVYGEGGIIGGRAGEETLEAFDERLSANATTITPSWGDMLFDLTVTKVDGWEYLIDDQPFIPDAAAPTKVPADATVTFRTSMEDTDSASLWKVFAGTGVSLEEIFLLENTYTPGDDHLDYTFTMPKKDVTATFNRDKTDFYFDLAQSPITFEENVVYNGLPSVGFWYRYYNSALPFVPLFALVDDGTQDGKQVPMAQLAETDTVRNYFYTWSGTDFYVTSHNVATQHQLTLVNGKTVHLKECNLVATSAYTTDVIGRKIAGTVIEGKTGGTVAGGNYAMAQYGNIVIDNSVVNSYAVTFVVEGENTVNGIFPNAFKHTADHNVTVTIKGTDTAGGSARTKDILHLGTLLGNFSVYWYDLTVKEITDASSEYLVYLNGYNESQSPLYVYGCLVEAPTKRIHTYRGSISVDYADIARYNSAARASQVTIGSGRSYGGTNLYCYSTLHVKGDLTSSYNTLTMSGNSKCIVDGNLDVDYQHWNVNPVLAGKYLIVKGAICSLGGANIYGNMVVIANGLVLTNQCKIYGNSRVIANQILNRPVKPPVVSATDGSYSWTGSSSYVESLSKNGDNKPFVTYSQSSTTTREYLFYGHSKVYLLGYYKTTANGTYDTSSATINSANNPIVTLIDEYLSSGSLADTRLEQAVQTETDKYTDATAPECIIIGNSLYDVENPNNQGKVRNVKISESAAIYAAGNLTFLNSTTISGTPTIMAGGSVSSKRALNISGGTITAESVGNRNQAAWNITTKDADGISRLSTTTISGGTLNVDSLGSSGNLTTLVVTGSPTINPRAINGTVEVYQDVLISYIYDENFVVEGAPAQDQETISLVGTWQNGAMSGISTVGGQEKLFPTITTTGGVWAMGSVQGDSVTKITADGKLDDANTTSVYEMKKLPLYAVKSSNSLVVKALKEGSTITKDGETLALNTSIDVPKGVPVTLTLGSAADADHLVLCYYDANGALHNVLSPDTPITGTSVTFTMPAAAVELYITDEFSLDLYQYPVTLTATGFSVVGEGEDRADGTFTYGGDIRIWQSVTHATNSSADYLTNNKIHFLGTVSGRTVTLNNINQAQVGTMSIEVGENVPATITVDGYARTGSIHLPYSSSLTIEGKNEGRVDSIDIKRATIDSTYPMIGNLKEGTSAGLKEGVGNVTFRDLTVKRPNNANTSGILVYATGDSTHPNYCDKVIFENVTVAPNDGKAEFILASQGSLTSSVRNVEFINSSVEQVVNTSYASPVFAVVANLTLKNSTVTIKQMGAGYGAYGLCNYTNTVAPKVVMDGSTVTYEHRSTVTDRTFYENQRPAIELALTMKNGSTFNADRRVRLKSLVLEGGELAVGYLFCNNITVSGGVLRADYIINSAYALYRGTTDADARQQKYEDFVNWATAASGTTHAKYRTETGNFTMTGGTVEVGEFIGGAYGATLNIQGGELSAPAIGTYPAIFGYASVIPPEEEPAAYQYAITPNRCDSTVNISGGEVHVTNGGYLGGHNSTVAVSGGTVNLGANAVLGLTELQRITAENNASANRQDPAEELKTTVTISGGTVEGESASILTPYRTTAISGATTAVKVSQIAADQGTVTIAQAKGAYEVPQVEGEKEFYNPTGLKPGVYVADRIQAQTITVKDGAVIYAKTLKAEIPAEKEGGLRLSGSSTAFAENYGVSGPGAKDNSQQVESGSQIIPLQMAVPIWYTLNDDPTDRATYAEGEKNPEFYWQDPTATLRLKEPKRHGYIFDGWYNNGMFAGNKVTELHQSDPNPAYLFAKWTPIPVTITVVLDTTKVAGVDLGQFDEHQLEGSYDSTTKKFTFGQTFEIPYRGRIQGGAGINLAQLPLPMWQVVTLEYTLNGGAAYTTVASADDNYTILDASIFDNATVGADGKRHFTLYVKAVDKTRVPITFHINKAANGLPVDAKFVGGSGAEDATSALTRSSHVDFGAQIGAGQGFVENGAFLAAAATGYTFKGWATTAEEKQGETLYQPQDLRAMTLTKDMPTAYYARWEAKTYTVQFNAVAFTGTEDSANITPGKDIQPTDQTSHPNTITATVKYDQKLDGNLVFDQAQYSAFTGNSLPAGWTKGYKFDHWQAQAGTEGKWDVSSATVLNKASFGTLLNVDSAADEVALTLTAIYDRVKVTYDLDGGKWTDTAILEALETNDPKANYTDLEPVPGAALVGLTDTGEVHSTNAATFAANGNTYGTGDYRYTLLNKGHTFQGWFNGATEVKNNPDYEDLTVTAKWTANNYTLVLNALDTEKQADAFYPGIDFRYEYTDGAAPKVTVSVEKVLSDGQTGENGFMVNVGNWPDRDTGAWYACNTGTEGNTDARRYLLGFTFSAYNPGNTTTDAYTEYAGDVTVLTRQGAMLVKDQSQFFIPDVELPGGVKVPDYPSGSEIQMYALYRERSLVFYEYYIHPTTLQTVQREVYSAPYQNWSDYPTTYATSEDLAAVQKLGYSLVGWYYYGAQTTNQPYSTADDYETFRDAHVAGTTQGGIKGTFDIPVYTVFVAQDVKKNYSLTGNGASYGSAASQTSEYVLPASMQEGYMGFAVTKDGQPFTDLTFVPKDTLEQNLYTGGDYANKTVAVGVELIGAQTYTFDLAQSGVCSQTYRVGKDWKIRFTLYTSHVVSSSEKHTFDLTFTFQDAGLSEQKIIFQDMSIQMVPSQYQVTYNAQLPQDTLTFTQQNGFAQATQTITETVNYGAELRGVPQLEGYTNIGWYERDGAKTPYTTLTMPTSETDQGKINLTTDWSAKMYNLHVNAAVLQHWTVSYTPLQGTLETLDEATLQGAGVDIPYHATVTFSSKSAELYDRHQEFVAMALYTPDTNTVTSDLNYNLLLHSGGDGSFLIGDHDIKATFTDERTLYLETDNISIEPTQYVHNGDTVTWHGKYIIKMNESNSAATATDHVLTLNGALGERSIQLGNLNISSNDSIQVTDGSTATLTLLDSNTTVTARNITVPATAALTMNGVSGTNDKVVLTPAAGKAGIGDAASSGTITLNDLAIDLTMPAGSDASGIGAKDTWNTTTLHNCTVQVDESSATGTAPYSGAWLGGSGGKVNFNGSTLTQKTGMTPVSSYAFKGGTVNISGSNVAADASVFASTALNITDSALTQDISFQAARVPVGGGNISVTNSTVTVGISGAGGWRGDHLYSGTMKINDAQSAVTIKGHRLLEVGNGNIAISETGYTQDGTNLAFDGRNYVLLGNKNSTSTTLTTNNPNAVIKLDTLATSATLASITFTGAPTFEGATGKTLTVNGDFSGTGDLTLKDIVVSASGNVGSKGNVNSSNQPVETASTVTVEGASTITAMRFGALGDLNDTFTFVKLPDNGATINANLVQDHYRIKYVYDGEDKTIVAGLDKVFRTATAEGVSVSATIPNKPTDVSNWYYSIGGDLYAVSNTLPTGYTRSSPLKASLVTDGADTDTTGLSDGTVYVMLYADGLVKGTANLALGRKFTAKDFPVTADMDIELPANHAFTALLTATGASIPGGQYRFDFGSALPAGTRLTLTVLSKDEQHKSIEYYYCIADGTKIAFAASDFVPMGGGDAAELPKSLEMSPTNEDTRLLSVDFMGTNAAAMSAAQEVKFQFFRGENNKDIATFTYQLTAVADGTVTVTQDSNALGGTVRVTTPANSVYAGGSYKLVAELPNSTPYDAKVTLGGTSGTRISAGKFLFDSAPTTATNFVVSGVYGNFSVQWHLVLAEDGTNVMGTVLASSSKLTFSNLKAEPSLQLVLTTLDNTTVTGEPHHLDAGAEHTATFQVVTGPTEVKYTLQTQSTLLADFANGTIHDVNANSIEVTIPSKAGVYRLAVSLDGDSWDDNDNAYYTFVVN